MASNPMILSGFFFNPQGDHRMSWRHPGAPRDEIYDLDYYRALALSAEAARLDAMFVADHVAMWDTYESNVVHYANARLEPLTMLSALAAVTKHIGLIATVSASYTEPYNLARAFASLDHLSRGRAAWNIVTSGMDEEAMNYGRDGSIEHATRYTRAAEFVDIVTALWDSWEDGAVLMDKDSGRFADPARIHRIDHEGRFFKVRGPLNVPRPPQGHPILVQAGSSKDGKGLASRVADLHFSLSRSIDEGRRYRNEMNELLGAAGRVPSSLRILPGILPIVARSASEAAERREMLDDLVPERIAVDLASSWCGIDLSGYPANGPLPPLPDESTYNGQRTNLARLASLARQGLTIREIARQLIDSGTAPIMAGTAKDIADEMEAWYTQRACDGFNLMFQILPGDWHNFMREVIPELQRRGLARTEYGPGTLRERLGLPRPPNRFSGM